MTTEQINKMSPSPEEATVSVRTGFKRQDFEVTRDGDTVRLDGSDNREFDDREFRYVPRGQLLRVYRRVE